MSAIENSTMGSFNPLFGLAMSCRHNLKKFDRRHNIFKIFILMSSRHNMKKFDSEM